jgi:hypothetical protein
MKWWLIVGLMLIAGSASAAVINDKGTSGAPKSVTTATTVLDGKLGRRAWAVITETVDIRCMTGNRTTAPTVVPSTTVGFIFKAGVLYNEGMTAGLPEDRLDCASTGGATNVDTWETF